VEDGKRREFVLAAVREHAVRQVAAEARSVDRDRAFPAAGLRALSATGGYGLVVPGSAGGAGGSLENVNRWVDGDESGYAELIEAVRWRAS